MALTSLVASRLDVIARGPRVLPVHEICTTGRRPRFPAREAGEPTEVTMAPTRSVPGSAVTRRGFLAGLGALAGAGLLAPLAGRTRSLEGGTCRLAAGR